MHTYIVVFLRAQQHVFKEVPVLLALQRIHYVVHRHAVVGSYIHTHMMIEYNNLISNCMYVCMYLCDVCMNDISMYVCMYEIVVCV